MSGSQQQAGLRGGAPWRKDHTLHACRFLYFSGTQQVCIWAEPSPSRRLPQGSVQSSPGRPGSSFVFPASSPGVSAARRGASARSGEGGSGRGAREGQAAGLPGSWRWEMLAGSATIDLPPSEDSWGKVTLPAACPSLPSSRPAPPSSRSLTPPPRCAPPPVPPAPDSWSY